MNNLTQSREIASNIELHAVWEIMSRIDKVILSQLMFFLNGFHSDSWHNMNMNMCLHVLHQLNYYLFIHCQSRPLTRKVFRLSLPGSNRQQPVGVNTPAALTDQTSKQNTNIQLAPFLRQTHRLGKS